MLFVLPLSVSSALSLAACASQGRVPYEEPHVVSQIQTSNSYLSEAQNLADLTTTEKEIDLKDPCPRFLHHVSAAQSIVDQVPRDYPHML